MGILAAVLFTALLAVIFYHATVLRHKRINAFVRGGEYTAFAAYYGVFVYTVYASTFGWPYPENLVRPLFVSQLAEWAGIALCLVGTASYALCAKHLHGSYRIGID
jgi:hypothetical protein